LTGKEVFSMAMNPYDVEEQLAGLGRVAPVDDVVDSIVAKWHQNGAGDAADLVSPRGEEAPQVRRQQVRDAAEAAYAQMLTNGG
jgi:hypothetical protein